MTGWDGLRVDAVLFDLDGVLVDSGSTVERSWRRWAHRHSIEPAVVLGSCHGRTTAATIGALTARFGLAHIDPVAEARKLEAEQAADTSDLRPCPGAGIVNRIPPDRWAVVTSGGRSLAMSRLRQAGLPVPGVLITADDVRHGKPDPEGYRTAAAALGAAPSECVVIEDARPGVLAARAAQCQVIGVAGPSLGPTDDVDVVVENLAAMTVTADSGGVWLRMLAVTVDE